MTTFTPEYLAEDRGHTLLSVGIVFIVLQTIFFTLFIASRFTVRSSTHGLETWFFMPAAYICCLCLCVVCIMFVELGGSGRHTAYWLLTDPSTVRAYLKLQTVAEAIYMASITFPKLAIIALYLKIFTNRWIRWATWLNGLLIILTALAGLILCFAICQPFSFNWNKSIDGHCGDLRAAYRFISVPNLLSDIGILVLPISTLYQLKVSFWKKVGIFITFLVGSLGIVTASIRLVEFCTVAIGSDPTWNSARTGIWIIIESSAYLIFAILPHLRSLLRHLFQGTKLSDGFSTLASRMLGRSTGHGDSTPQKEQHLPLPDLPRMHKITEISLMSSSGKPEKSGFVPLEGHRLHHDGSAIGPEVNT